MECFLHQNWSMLHHLWQQKSHQKRSSPWLSVQASAQVVNNDTVKPNTQKDSVPHLFFTILNALREGPPY